MTVRIVVPHDAITDAGTVTGEWRRIARLQAYDQAARQREVLTGRQALLPTPRWDGRVVVVETRPEHTRVV